jgi:dTDP-L-rhamnose 4-epimerase
MESPAADGHAVNVGSGAPISVEQVARELAAELGVALEPQITGQYRAGDIRHCFADIALARQLLGYEPRFSFRSGVAELVEWLRSQTAEDHAAEAAQQLRAYGLTA